MFKRSNTLTGSRSFARTSDFKIRKALACVLCVLVLATSPAAILAQQVSRSANTKKSATPNKATKVNKNYKAKRQDSAGRIQQKIDSEQERQGVPQEGAAGVTESVESIMERQKENGNKPPVERTMPEREGPDRSRLPQDPNAPAVSSFPTNPDTKPNPTVKKSSSFRPTAPQTTGTNFLGATLTDTGAFPPDTMGAVGPTQFTVFVNGRIRTFNKTTGVADGVINADPDIFFASILTPVPAGGVNFTSDPNVRYDRLSARWFLTIIDVPSSSTSTIGDTPNRILIAVSDAASAGVLSASTVWTFYFVQQDLVGLGTSSGEFLDYPSLGIDANALYIGGNMFGAVSGSFTGTNAYVIRKSSVLSGGPVVTTAFRALSNGSTQGPFAPRGVDNYDPAATEGFFIGVSIINFGQLVTLRVSTPGGTPTLSANLVTTIATTSNPRSVDHLGDTGGANGNLDALDDRLYAAHLRNGRLWTAHNISVDTTGTGVSTGAQRRTASRWYELIVPPTTGTPTVNQFGTIFDTAATRALAREYWIPSAMVSGQGHAAFGYSTAGTPFPINAATNGRLSSDTLGTSQAVVIYTTNTTNAYNPPSDPGPTRRWGDYSFTSLDPKDDMTMWTIQEYCSSTNIYGVQAVKLIAPPPATPATATSALSGQSSVNVVVTGTSTAGSGFYDPGIDLAPPALPFNHIAATVSGGVVVNSVTYTDPTHVTLNVNTTAATPGPKNVTITNPDGQTVTTNNILNVTAAAGSVIISEFRTRGSSGASAGADDEFVELLNTSNATVDISNFSIAEDGGAIRYTAPAATTIPAFGHFLVTGSAYSLAGYAASNGTLTAGIADNTGIALFVNNNTTTFSSGTKMDAAGFTSATNPLYREGTGLVPPAGAAAACECSYVRKASLTSGVPQDTNNNANDFVFVATDGLLHEGRQSILGAPGPENLASPRLNNSLVASLIAPMNASSASPNRVRDARPYDIPAGAPVEYPSGTLSIQRRFTNPAASGVTLTSLRFRIVDITTLGSPGSGAGQADLRVISSTGAVTDSSGNTVVTVMGTTLQTPPAQPNGGGQNSTLTVTLPGGGLTPGSSIDVQLLLGVSQAGNFRFFISQEALP
jgi:hypothetical protein